MSEIAQLILSIGFSGAAMIYALRFRNKESCVGSGVAAWVTILIIVCSLVYLCHATDMKCLTKLDKFLMN